MCHKFLACGVRLAAAAGLLFFLICQLFAGPIVGLFLERGDPLFGYTAHALRLYSLSFLVLGFNVVVSGFFTAMEHPFPALTISFGRSLVLISGALVALSALFGDTGIWLSPLVSEGLCLIFTIVFLLWYFRRVKHPGPTCEKSGA